MIERNDPNYEPVSIDVWLHSDWLSHSLYCHGADLFVHCEMCEVVFANAPTPRRVLTSHVSCHRLLEIKKRSVAVRKATGIQHLNTGLVVAIKIRVPARASNLSCIV